MCLRFVFLLLTRMTSWLRWSRREEAWQTAEILILRHQLAVLQRRQPHRPNLHWADRALLATLLSVTPKARRQGLRLLVTPATILRWHRDIVRRRWTARSIRGRTGRSATRRTSKALVPLLARENPGGGYRGIRGEPAGLGVKIAAPAAWEILKGAGIDPAPRRTCRAWPQFLRTRAEAILACGLFNSDLLNGTQPHVLAVISTPAGASASSGSPCIQPGVGRSAGPQPDHGPGRAGASGQVRDRRPRPGLHGYVRRHPRRRRIPAVLCNARTPRMNAIAERWIGGMPARALGPHPDLGSRPSAADPARVRDPPPSAPASPLPGCSCAAEIPSRTGRFRPVPRTKTGSRRWPDQRTCLVA